MSFIDLAKKRYSVRSYLPKPVEEEKLMRVLEAGRVAPSAVNYQPYFFVVVRDEEKRRDIATSYPRPWILQAPVVIVICADHSRSWRRKDGKDHADIDAAIAIDHMTLEAAEAGLGTCWVCAFDAMLCHQILNLPPHIETIALLPLGYPADSADPDRHEKGRKNLDDLVFWDEYIS